MSSLQEKIRSESRIMSSSEFEAEDRVADPALDEFVRLAAEIAGADCGYLAWLEGSQLGLKSTHGFSAWTESALIEACHRVTLSGVALLVKDAATDLALNDLPSKESCSGVELDKGMHYRSYLGIPLMGLGDRVVGTLAVLSVTPGRFNAEHRHMLCVLGRQAVTRMELYVRAEAQDQRQRSRHRLERALAGDRHFVAATLDSIPALVAVLDTAGRVVGINRPCEELTGLRMGEVVGRRFVDELLVESEAHGWALEKVRQAAAGESVGPYENLWRTQPGEPRRVSWTLRPMIGQSDDVDGGSEAGIKPGLSAGVQYLIVSGRDVTGQRRAEEAVLTNETRSKHVVENSLKFVFTCTLDGRLTSLNGFTAESLGYRPEELNGKPLAEFLSKPGLKSFDESLKTVLAKGEYQGTIPFLRKDGSERQIAFRSRRMDLPGSASFVLTHGMDVTEQHDIEDELQLMRRQRELILSSIDDGIYGLDLEGKMTFMNPAAAKMLGYKAEELRGMDLHEVIHHSHKDGSVHAKATCQTLSGMLRREAVRVRDDVFWRKDGETIQVEYVASPLLDEGQIAGMVVAFRDISERRRLERMKDEFISTVSHELRTPLTSLRASLGLISSGSLAKRPEKQKQMLDVAIGNCDRLVKLVNDILDFDRVEKGGIPLHFEVHPAGDILRRAADVENEAAIKAEVTFRFDSPRTVTINVDQDRILQVLSELVSNAIKFSPPQTIIKLAAQAAGEGVTRIMVEDQGRGIPQEKLDMIFERFQQGDASDSRALGGTGLGLAFCRRIVQQHGGTDLGGGVKLARAAGLCLLCRRARPRRRIRFSCVMSRRAMSPGKWWSPDLAMDSEPRRVRIRQTRLISWNGTQASGEMNESTG